VARRRLGAGYGFVRRPDRHWNRYPGANSLAVVS
jgi:hypothetical protein